MSTDHPSPTPVERRPAPPINVHGVERLLSLGIGIAMLVGLSRRLAMTLAAAGAAGYLVYRGVTGHCHLYQTAGLNSDRSVGRWLGDVEGQAAADAESSAAGGANQRDRGQERPRDEVEEALWQSFPASDPPASW